MYGYRFFSLICVPEIILLFLFHMPFIVSKCHMLPQRRFKYWNKRKSYILIFLLLKNIPIFGTQRIQKNVMSQTRICLSLALGIGVQILEVFSGNFICALNLKTRNIYYKISSGEVWVIDKAAAYPHILYGSESIFSRPVSRKTGQRHLLISIWF